MCVCYKADYNYILHVYMYVLNYNAMLCTCMYQLQACIFYIHVVGNTMFQCDGHCMVADGGGGGGGGGV